MFHIVEDLQYSYNRRVYFRSGLLLTVIGDRSRLCQHIYMGDGRRPAGADRVCVGNCVAVDLFKSCESVIPPTRKKKESLQRRENQITI